MASKFADDESSPKVVPIKERKPREDQFPVTWVSDAKVSFESRPVVKGLIDAGAFVVIYGPSGSGKSFFTADLAQHIATGQPWRGRRVDKGLVVYVASEAGGSILKRFVAWRDNKLGEASGDIPLAILTRGPNLIAGTDFEKLAQQLAEMESHAGVKLQMVVFDTLSRSMAGGDENSAEDMTKVIQAADWLRDQYGCATAFVHHSGKDPDKGARGHSALFAAADLVMKVVDHQATVEKVRDGVAGEGFGFVLEPVEIGTDADGDAVMTCLLNPTDAGPMKPRSREPAGANQRIVLPEIRALAGDRGERSPGSSAIPKGVLMVLVEDVYGRCEPKFPPGDAFRTREKIKTALMGLQASGFIGLHGDRIWLP